MFAFADVVNKQLELDFFVAISIGEFDLNVLNDDLAGKRRKRFVTILVRRTFDGKTEQRSAEIVRRAFLWWSKRPLTFLDQYL